MNKNRILKISLTANLIEWYEFVVSAYLATVMGHVFFNNHNQSDAIAAIQFFSVFALSYLVRPLGCIFWGIIGDKYSSAIALRWSLILMAIPTVIIGLLPSYSQIGISATLLFTLLKIIQGFAAGGEFPLSSIYVFDKALQYKSANLFCSLVNSSGMIGMLLASATIAILNIFFSQATIIEYAWRIPFLLGIPLFIIILNIRNSIIADNSLNHECKLLFNFQIKPIIKAIMLIAFLQINMYVLFVWLPTYLKVFLRVNTHVTEFSNTLAMIALTIFTIAFGYLGTKISYKRIIPYSAIILTLLICPAFYLLIYGNNSVIYLVQILFALILSPIQGTFLYAINDLFATHKKNLLLSITYTIPSAIFGGLTPLLCGFYISKLDFLAFPGFLILGLGILTIPVLFRL